MWCDRCRADAAAEISLETDRATCATCGHDLGPVRRPATDHARALLKKWSAAIDLEATVEPRAAHRQHGDEAAAGEPVRLHRDSIDEAARENSLTREPAAATPWREASHDAAVPNADVGREASRDEPAVASMPSDDDETARPTLRIDPSHARNSSTPHFDVHMAIASQSEKGGQGAQTIGQILAYAGVLALTVGTALVIWSYFSGDTDYAPTGWLVATGGQMLLFLGVVTLVAGGLEQTSREVRVRVESLGERLTGIEKLVGELAAANRANASSTSAARLDERTRLRA